MIRALVVVALLAGCGGSATTDPPDTPEPAAFGIAAVKASFTEECEDPIVLDELFCQQVDIDGMTAEGSTLIVPTLISALDGMRDRAQVICQQFAQVHFDGEGVDLGYEFIGVRNRDGGNAAACSV